MIYPNKIEIYNAENCVRFKEPIVVEYYPREFSNGEYTIHFEYDFGMSDKFTFSENTVWLGIKPQLTDEEIVRLVVEFDLAHAFDHPQDDPNYNHTHWSLYGNLKDRFHEIYS